MPCPDPYISSLIFKTESLPLSCFRPAPQNRVFIVSGTFCSHCSAGSLTFWLAWDTFTFTTTGQDLQLWGWACYLHLQEPSGSDIKGCWWSQWVWERFWRFLSSVLDFLDVFDTEALEDRDVVECGLREIDCHGCVLFSLLWTCWADRTTNLWKHIFCSVDKLWRETCKASFLKGSCWNMQWWVTECQ